MPRINAANETTQMVPEKNPIVVVTGASAGVGRAVAREFAARHQARIGLLARDAERLQTAKEEV